MNTHHIGTTTCFVLHTSTPLFLNQLLYVPRITKNLMSVSKFAKDNNVYFRLYDDSCYVKNYDTKEIILKGIIKDSL